ncbi:MAG TPA: EamA family transporter [Pseudolabrys sp.]|uniref:aromatic amino acid exporter YddG n=1 Tax=Pseudolabrys sp. TaxID=1960880 RepID=UPI002DDD466B|nr:EamA family transporter [Pseudolabrys sp.]HEV2629788.1 EamA family transporter [Pseudolabrys sp.]
MSSLRATLIGFSAILMWSLLAVLTVLTGQVPPFQLLAMTFAVGGVFGVARVAQQGALGALCQPLQVWALGVGGLFGYHALYFTALRLAPPAEAGLLNYFWPLLIVLFSGLLPGERLPLKSVAGALLGFAGTIVLFLGKGLTLALDHTAGYAAAVCAAFVWAGYSVLSRRLANVPTATVAGFCIATAVLAALAHMLTETTVWPQDVTQWLAVVLLGVGPVGIAFYVWDIGVKRGDIRLLGVASYAAPILSTAFLVLAGFAEARASLALSALLISGGGLIAASGRTTK